MPDYDEIGTPRLARQRVSREVQYRAPLEPAVISARNAAKPVPLAASVALVSLMLDSESLPGKQRPHRGVAAQGPTNRSGLR